jgi:hypothetical protein
MPSGGRFEVRLPAVAPRFGHVREEAGQHLVTVGGNDWYVRYRH